ncbi:semaphorin-4B-like [Puntigrus tetrazona]|uniref:semaphorin-4B-like n=1 Tax=Puntigrus tetrazona TaxID=1606681 RepID=UPI001C8A9355|nr:semaphorin-4B-like [Puntigrus tetrazona]
MPFSQSASGQSDAMTLKEKLDWSPSEKDLTDCAMKGKMKMDCHNFVRVLQVLNSTHMFSCGTFAFSPRCIYINSETFSMATGPSGKPEEGRGRCPYDPYQKNTAITVDGELYRNGGRLRELAVISRRGRGRRVDRADHCMQRELSWFLKAM